MVIGLRPLSQTARCVLPDRRFDVAASQPVRGFVVGSHLVSSFVEIKLALSQEEESQRTVHRGVCRRRAGEG